MKLELSDMAAKSKVKETGKSAALLSVFNQKGGCGKTMTSMQLAGTLGRMGVKTFLIDMDPQNTAALWYHEADAVTNPFPADVLSMAPQRETFVSKLEGISKNYDLIVIDCPPALGSQVPWASLLVADLAIIPVMPVMDNVWASKQAEELVLQAMAVNPALKAKYLMSRVQRGKVYESCYEVLRSKAELPFFETKISQRNAYPESQVYGCVVSMFGKSPATDEMTALAHEVAELLNLTLSKD